MNNVEDILQLPFREHDSWSQFLIACGVMLAAFVIPILPTVRLTGYTVKIMRQIIVEKRTPSMPVWQASDWSEMFMDGLRLYGAQIVLMLPLFLLLGCGVTSLLGGTVGTSAVADQGSRNLGPLAVLLLFLGIFFTVFSLLLSVPYGVILSAAQAHVEARRSFNAAFDFRECWQIFRAAMGQLLGAYVVMLIASFILAFVVQIAMITIVLICIVPLLMIPYSVYLTFVSNALYAQAYAKGQESLHTS